MNKFRFSIGQRVKCLRESGRPTILPELAFTKKGEVYTIKDIDTNKGIIYGIYIYWKTHRVCLSHQNVLNRWLCKNLISSIKRR